MTSSDGGIFCVAGLLCGEFTGHFWIPHVKASDAELWRIFIYAWTDSWANNGNAGDLRRYRAHYDVIVIIVKVMKGIHDDKIAVFTRNQASNIYKSSFYGAPRSCLQLIKSSH